MLRTLAPSARKVGSLLEYSPWPHLWMSNLLVKYSAIEKVRTCPTAPERNATDLRRDRSGGGTTIRAWLVEDNPARSYQGKYSIGFPSSLKYM